MMIEVIAEFRPFFLFTRHHSGDDMGVLPQIITDFCQQRGVFGKALHQNVACAIEGGFRVGHAFIGIDKFRGFGFRVVGRRCPQQIRQRRQASFNGDLSAGAAFLFVRQVEVFELGFIQGAVDGFCQIVGQLPLFTDGFQDRLTPVFQFTQIAKAGFQVTQLRIIQTASHFLTITCDKRHGVPFIKQANGSFYLFSPCLKFTRNNAAERIFHHGYFILWVEKSGDSYTD